MNKNLHASGIGGWLAFLIFGLMILWPLIQMGSLSNGFREAIENMPELAIDKEWLLYKQVSWLIFIISSTVSFSAGYKLWKLHLPESVHYANYSLWLSGPGAQIGYSFSALVIFKLPLEKAAIAMVPLIVMSILLTGVWVAYLKFSVRVKNTYNVS